MGSKDVKGLALLMHCVLLIICFPEELFKVVYICINKELDFLIRLFYSDTDVIAVGYASSKKFTNDKIIET